MEGISMQKAPVSQERKESKKTSFEKLNEVMARMSREVNSMVKEQYDMEALVDDAGRIRAELYAKEEGGIYEGAEVADDQEIVDGLDRHNSSADDPRVQEFYKKEYGADGTAEGTLAKYRERKEAAKSNQAEVAITALLHKMLKERFLVVRASTFDDYKHGMDNLILDRETGAVICAFDEVIRNEGDAGKTPVKLEKIKKAALKGGNEAKYGIALKDDTLVRSRLRNVPVFYLSLESKDLNALTNDLTNGFDSDATALEQALFAHLVNSIKEQKDILEKLPLPQVMKNKLSAFEESLGVLEGVASN
ncbi:MAG: hypothetical protein M0P64_00095 [Candidatus Pacebacteria bacterium]|jgi:hypothetical protein|nr:hypothetical protein [Candidatus Paceibacterota bacterium]